MPFAPQVYALCYSCIECCWSFDFCSQNWFHCYSSTALIGIPVPWYLNHKHNSLFTDTVFESQCFTFSSVDWQQTYFTYTDPARQSNSHHTCHVTRNLVPAAPWPVRMPARPSAISVIIAGSNSRPDVTHDTQSKPLRMLDQRLPCPPHALAALASRIHRLYVCMGPAPNGPPRRART